jgi:hypothetical protein
MATFLLDGSTSTRRISAYFCTWLTYIGKSPTVPCTLKVDSSIFRSATVMMDATLTYHTTSTIIMSMAMVISYWMGLPLLGAYFCTWLAYIGKSLTVPCMLKVDSSIFRSTTVMMDATSTYHTTSTIIMSTATTTSYWMGLPY